MILDEYDKFSEIDPNNYLGLIDALPDQLSSGWEMGCKLASALPDWQGINQGCIHTLGGSTAAADLLAAVASAASRVPIGLHNGGELPAWVNGPQTLLAVLAHNSDPKTIEALESSANRGCRRLVISPKPELRTEIISSGGIFWDYVNTALPRTTVGTCFSQLLAAFSHLGLIDNPEEDIHAAIKVMRVQQSFLRNSSPLHSNPAKRLAGQLMGRHVVIFGAGSMASIARRWKNQINEVAKAGAQWEAVPEACFNAAAGTIEPEYALARTMVVFLHAPHDRSGQKIYLKQIRHTFLQAGIGTDTYIAQGNSVLENLWTGLHFGDYVSYYLAILYGVDPSSDFTNFYFTAE